MTARRRAVLAAGGLLVAGSTAAYVLATHGEDEGRSATVTREDFRIVVEATGKLDAAVSYEIGPPSVRDVWNYNLKWMIPEGSRVAKGDVVMRFDTTDLDERLRDYGARLETTVQEREKEERNLEISLRQRRLDLVKAKGEVEKTDVELSVPEGLISAMQLEELRLKRDLTRRRVRFLEEKIAFERELVKSKLELLDVKRRRDEQLIASVEESKRRFAVASPIDGLVIYIPKRNGDRWEVGERVWMLAKLLEIADVSTLRVDAQVLEADAARIEVGQRASVSIDAIPGSTLATHVAELGRLVRERSVQDRTKVFDAFLPIAAVDEETMRPGMGVHAAIEVQVLRERLTIPVGAVRASADGTFVRVLDGDGSPTTREVELGPRSGGRVVVEAGVEAGERVLLDAGESRA